MRPLSVSQKWFIGFAALVVAGFAIWAYRSGGGFGGLAKKAETPIIAVEQAAFPPLAAVESPECHDLATAFFGQFKERVLAGSPQGVTWEPWTAHFDGKRGSCILSVAYSYPLGSMWMHFRQAIDVATGKPVLYNAFSVDEGGTGVTALDDPSADVKNLDAAAYDERLRALMTE